MLRINTQFLVAAMAALAVSTAVLGAEGDKSDKTRIDAPASGRTHVVKCVIHLSDALRESGNDSFAAVKPELQEMYWVQDGPLLQKKNRRVVYCGTKQSRPEVFTIVVITVPSGAIEKDGPIPPAALKKLGGKVVAETDFERVE